MSVDPGMICGMTLVEFLTLFSVGCLAVGTVMQTLLASYELGRDTQNHVGLDVNDLMHEVPVWSWSKRRAHRADVKKLLAESPKERAVYQRVMRTVVAWALIMAGSIVAFVAVLVSFLMS